MTRGILPPEKGGLGSGVRRVLKVAHHGPTDLMLDDLRREPSVERAREVVASAGRARAKVPSYVPVSPPSVIDAVLGVLGEDWDSPLADELVTVADEAEVRGLHDFVDTRMDSIDEASRDHERYEAIQANEAVRAERIAAGLLPFEEYEVDALTGRQMPSPEEIADLEAVESDLRARAEVSAAYDPRIPCTPENGASREPSRAAPSQHIGKPASASFQGAPLSAAAAREAAMAALTRVPGLVGEIVDWIEATSMNPNRTLAFAAAIALVGTLAGRLYETETSLRTNIYTLSLAPSGFGKDHARSCASILVERAGCGAWLGGSKIASGTGMRRRVEDHPAIMWMIDEFGGFMHQISDPRNAHSHQIRDHLLEYYETAGDVFRGADYAGEQGRPCHNPNVSVHGLSTPTDFWGACQSLSAADGLLARFMIFSVGSTLEASVRPSRKKSEPPSALIEGLRNLTRPRVGGNLNGRLADGSTAARALNVPFEEDAGEAFYAARERFKARAFAKRGRAEESIYPRIPENALKIAMIIAIGVDADRPVISVERFEHGLAVAEYCAETTLREIKGRLADNDRQREHVDVRRWIVEAGWTGVGRTALVKHINGRFTERRLGEILQSLEGGSKEIVSILRPTKGRPAMRFVAVENLGSDEAES